MIYTKNTYLRSISFIIAMVMSLNVMAQTSTVSVYLTEGDESVLLEQQTDADFSTTFIDNNAVISVDETETYQSVVGFGWTLTQGSAKAIRSMSETDQDALLEELFHPSNGIRSSLIRISLGASDLSESAYTYNDLPYGETDEDLSEFSLDGPDKTDLIPILKKIVAINPDVRLLATPWTAPTWMKVENNTDWGGDPASANTFIGGRLNSTYFSTYADYFVKYVEAMEAEGLTIWGITPQNEPLNKHNEPSMLMNGDEQLNFVNNHLGPKLDAAGFDDVQVIAYDHNCDNTIYPIKVMASDYTDGAAFHLYGGDISAMTTVYEATNKDVYFTEQWVSANGDFGGDFGWHMKNIVVGSLRNWSRSVLEWNLAAFSDETPRTDGGCVGCLGAVTIEDDQSVTRNVAYYIIGQISKFVTEGATRIASEDLRGIDGLYHVAFKNEDGSKVALIYNDLNNSQTFTLQWGNQFLEQTIPANAAVTLIWTGTTATVPVANVSLDKTSISIYPDMQVQLTAEIAPFYASNQNITWSASNANASVADGLVTGVSVGSTTISVTTEDGSFTDDCDVTTQEITDHVTSVTLEYDDYVVVAGTTPTMGVTVLPANATNPALNWVSSDESILMVDENGNLTPIAAGVATLTATAWDGGHSDVANVTVLDIPIDTIAFLDNKASGGLRLEADGSENPLLTETIINTDNVKWRITAAPTNGYFYIDCRTHDNKRLSTNGGDLPVLVSSATIGNSVEWKFTESSTSGYYHIDSREEYSGINRLNKKSLTAAGITDNTTTNDAVKWQLTTAPPETSIALTDMTLSPEATTINLDATEQLSLVFTPSDATNQNVTWSSDNEAIVSVSQSGLITGESLGSATITVTSEEGSIVRTCDVIVQNISSSVSGVSLNTNYHLMKTVESFVLEATVEPADATEQGVTWSSDDETIITVSETGEITPVKQGKAIITATTIDGGFQASCTVTVLDINIENMYFISSKASGGLLLSASDGTTNPILNAAPYPTGDNTKWIITPTNDGAFYIDNFATTANRLSAIASTDGNAEMVSDTETADRAKWYINYEQTSNDVDYYFIQTKAAFDKAQFYKKSNTEAGMRSFAANDGGRWSFEVVPVALTDLTLSPVATTINVDDTEQLSLTFTPSNATNQNVTWSSDDASVSVSQEGVITAISVGSATITALAEDGSHTATCIVTVNSIAVTDITLAPEATTININDTEQLSLTFTPSNATNQNVTWSSDNASVTVNQEGLITGVSAGNATITAISEDGGFEATCQVTVVTPLTGITIEPESTTIDVAETQLLALTFLPAHATNQNVTWSSDDESVTVTQEGLITGVSVGTATITALSEDGGYTSTCLVTVEASNIAVTGITISPDVTTINVNDTEQLSLTFTPSNATNQNVIWSSDDESVTVTQEGLITGVSVGTATITALSEDGGHTSTCLVTVETSSIAVTGITISPDATSINVNDKEQLSLTFAPSNATNQNVTWSSDDESVTVTQEGLITGVSEGSATITAISEDGSHTATCLVTVDSGIEEILSTEELNLNQILLINRSISITIKPGFKTANVTVYRLDGQKIYSKPMAFNEIDINLHNTQAGVYFVLLNVDGRQETKKFLLR